MDHAETMRGLYAALNAGDLDGFGATLADDFVEHEETPARANQGGRPGVLSDVPGGVPRPAYGATRRFDQRRPSGCPGAGHRNWAGRVHGYAPSGKDVESS